MSDDLDTELAGIRDRALNKYRPGLTPPDVAWRLPDCPGTEFAVISYIAKRGGRFFRKTGIIKDCFFDYRFRDVVDAWERMLGKAIPLSFETTKSFMLKEKTQLSEFPEYISLGGGDSWLVEIYGGKSLMAEFDCRISEDMDAAGGFEFLCERLHELRQWRIISKACHKIGTRACLQVEEPSELRKMLVAELAGLETRQNLSVTSDALDEVRRMQVEREVGGSVSLATGIRAWDKSIHGIFAKRFYAIGARPKIGKSALIEQIVQNQHDAGIATLIFQRDMSVTDMMGRIACRKAGVIYEDFIAGTLDAWSSQAVRTATLAIDPALMRVYSPTNMTAQELALIVERETAQHNVKAFYLDLFQRLVVGKDRVEGLVDAANTLRQVIHDTGTPGIVLAEVTKESDKTGGRPTASQFKYCDGLFSACDTAIMLWSDDDPKALYDEAAQIMRRQRVYFTVDANRAGSVSDETMLFDRPRMKFFATEWNE